MESNIKVKKINFMKMSGAGNDFIIIDNRAGLINENINLLAKKLCSRRYSIGADGLILVENSKKANFRARLIYVGMVEDVWQDLHLLMS